MALFAGLDRAYGCYLLPKKTNQADPTEKVQGRPYTEHKPVTLELWENHLNGKRGLGIIPIRDNATIMWAGIDLDVYPIDLTALEGKLTALKLPLVISRSKSGGAHLLLFLKDAVEAKFIRQKLQEWVVALGFPGSEIFPKQNSLANEKDVGNWLNMPYYSFKDDDRRCGWYNGAAIGIDDFLTLAEGRKVTRDALERFVVTGDAELSDAPPCLQHLCKSGFPKGTRNMGLFNVGVYARLKYDDEWQEQLDVLNRQVMEPPLSTAEVANTVKSLKKKNYFYLCNKDPIVSVCNKEICKTRKFGIGNNDAGMMPTVMLGALSKIDSQSPTWIMDVDGYRIECTTDDLLNQGRFRKLCLDKINKLPGLLKQPIWEQLIRERLENVEVIEAPPDSGPEGQFKQHLEDFCTARAYGDKPDDLLLGKPYHAVGDDENALDGNSTTYFRSNDLFRYLDAQHFKILTERQVWNLLRKLGASHKQFQLKGKCVMAWRIPSFHMQTEAHAVPDITHGEI